MQAVTLRGCVAALALLAVGATAPAPSLPRAASLPAHPAAPAFASTETTLDVSGERTARAAVLAAGAPVGEANGALFALSEEVDVLRAGPPGAWRATLARDPATGATTLQALSFTGKARTTTARRGDDGTYAVARPDPARSEPVASTDDEAPPGEPTVVSGPVEEVLYGLGGGGPVPPLVLYRAVRVFGHRLDLARDVALGDRVRLIYTRDPRPLGGIGGGDLLYAELTHDGRTSRFYRADSDDAGSPRFVDAQGDDLSGYLLRTPVQNPRVTSGFGLRLHPLLGYTRMHRGVDFGAPSGTPVVAAADGEVETASWAGGYGRFLKLRHANGWATGYGHLSAWAPGIAPGMHVRQGQVVAYVGASGLATGPHLHYEVYRAGAAVDPASVARVGGEGGARPMLRAARFEAVKRRVADLLARAPALRAAAALPPGSFPPDASTLGGDFTAGDRRGGPGAGEGWSG